jgi:hypothetical protein
MRIDSLLTAGLEPVMDAATGRCRVVLCDQSK